tara:strand:+ start:1661 stop:1900 length:240 start_codon:yes stop_codon:yes gene_type:complete
MSNLIDCEAIFAAKSLVTMVRRKLEDEGQGNLWHVLSNFDMDPGEDHDDIEIYLFDAENDIFHEVDLESLHAEMFMETI